VDYHLAAAQAPVVSAAPSPEPAITAVLTPTRGRVLQLLESGLSRAEVAQALGITKSTVSYHARGLGKEMDERCARRYDWQRSSGITTSVTACATAGAALVSAPPRGMTP
jgi:DNA-binding transcriptional ArsR family regulator